MSDVPPANPDADDKADLRGKLDRALESNRKLTVENTLFKAGLGHLNEAQRHALTITLPKGTEISAESLKGQATALGFPLEVAPPAPPPPDPNAPPPPPAEGQPNPQDGSMPPTYDPGTQWLTPGPGGAHPDPRVNQSISGLTQQEEAHIQALRAQAGGTVGGGLDEALGKATSKAEVVAAIRQHGASAGLLLDSDLD